MRQFAFMLVMVVGATFGPRAAGQAWELQNPLPQAKSLSSIAFVNADTGVVLGAGFLMRTTNGGVDWDIQNDNAFIDGTVTATASGILWASGRPPLRSTDFGATWEAASGLPGDVVARRLFFVDDQHGWATTNCDTVLYTTDGGSSWHAGSIGPLGHAQGDICFVDSLRGWTCDEVVYDVFHTTDGGRTWARVDSAHARGLAFADSLNGWSFCGPEIRHTTDGGATWALEVYDQRANWQSIRCTNDHTCMVGSEGLILRTAEAGTTWSSVFEGNVCALFPGLSFRDENHGYAAGSDGIILSTDDGGATWAYLAHGDFCPHYAISFADAENGWVAGKAGTILHTTNGGADWQPQSSGLSLPFRCAEFLSPEVGWVAGDFGWILHTTDGGQTWDRQPDLLRRTITDLEFFDLLHGWAVIDYGSALYTEDGGATWLDRLPGNTGHHTQISAVSETEAYLTSNSVSLHTTDAGLSWDTTFAAMQFADVVFTDPMHGWGYRDDVFYDIVYATRDGGQSWNESARRQENTNPARLFARDSNNVWMYRCPAGMRTTDGGANWEDVAMDCAYDMAVLDARHVWSAGLGPAIRHFVPQGEENVRPGSLPVPEQIALAVSPNPFNPAATLSFDMATEGKARLAVYDVTGRLVQTLADKVFAAGHHTLNFDGSVLPSGIYFAQCRSHSVSKTLKLVLLK